VRKVKDKQTEHHRISRNRFLKHTLVK